MISSGDMCLGAAALISDGLIVRRLDGAVLDGAVLDDAVLVLDLLILLAMMSFTFNNLPLSLTIPALAKTFLVMCAFLWRYLLW